MKPTAGPSPETIYPIKDYDKLVFLKDFVIAKNILIEDYTYFDDRRHGPEKFEKYNVLVKLIIGIPSNRSRNSLYNDRRS